MLEECLNIVHVFAGTRLCGVIHSAVQKYMERNLWEDSDDLAGHANTFIRNQLRAVPSIALHEVEGHSSACHRSMRHCSGLRRFDTDQALAHTGTAVGARFAGAHDYKGIDGVPIESKAVDEPGCV